MRLWRRWRSRPAKPPKKWVPWFTIALVGCTLLLGGVLSILKWAGVVGPQHDHTRTSAARTARANTPPPTLRPASDDPAAVRRAQNELANKQIPQGDSTNQDVGNFDPQIEVNATTPSLKLPKSTGEVAGVASGFARTPQGAVAQLAAMDATAYHNFDADAGREVYNQFAMPGAVGINQWNPTSQVLKYYAANPGTDPQLLQASYTPVQGLIKGSVGHDFTVVCINGHLTYSYKGDARTVAAWDCARMQWSTQHKRWMLAPGGAPAKAPLTWPRDQLSYQSGFRDLQNPPA